jgi:hypothetical protein
MQVYYREYENIHASTLSSMGTSEENLMKQKESKQVSDFYSKPEKQNLKHCSVRKT